MLQQPQSPKCPSFTLLTDVFEFHVILRQVNQITQNDIE